MSDLNDRMLSSELPRLEDLAYDEADLADLFPPDVDLSLLPGLEDIETSEPHDSGWAWQDARLIALDRGEVAGDRRYEIGVIDLYANADTGDLGGSYLPITAFTEEVPATAFYHDLERQMHDLGLADDEVAAFGETQAMAMNAEPENWRGAEPAEYAVYERLCEFENFDPNLADIPSDEALDPLIQAAIDLGGIIAEPEIDEMASQALSAIGVQVEKFNPAAEPPFYDAETGTSYWIGVFQPTQDDRENCVASILSLGPNTETGAMEAQLAPFLPGDWDKAYSAAEQLLQVAERGGIEQIFDTAEGIAMASGQRELWETGRGLAIEVDEERDIADITQELDL